MIPKEAIELYHSISAPDSLKNTITDRLKSTTTQKKQPWKPVLTMAACVALVVITTLTALRPPAAELTINGALIDTEPVSVTLSAPMAARALPAVAEPMEIMLELNADKGASVHVTHGQVIHNGQSLIWTIPGGVLPEETAVLTVTNNKKEVNYSLFCDDAKNWYLVKADKK